MAWVNSWHEYYGSWSLAASKLCFGKGTLSSTAKGVWIGSMQQKRLRVAQGVFLQAVGKVKAESLLAKYMGEMHEQTKSKETDGNEILKRIESKLDALILNLGGL